MDEIFELPLDKTGSLSSNRIKDEPHTLAEQNIRTVSPLKGIFFSDSLLIVDKESGKELKVIQDYIITEHYHSLSQFYGKDIAGMIVITNPAVGDDIEITYQAVGELYNVKDEVLKEFLEKKLKDENSSSLLWEIYNNQTLFVPSDAHLDVGDQVGFEYLMYGLERIRNSILLSDFDITTKLIETIDLYLGNLSNLMDERVKNNYLPIVNEFIKQFDKVKLKLDKVANLTVATVEDMRLIADADYAFNGEDKYVTLKGITALKEEIYNRLVTKKQTNLGVHYGVIAFPLLTTLETLSNGATVIIDAYDNYSLSSAIVFDSAVYPELTTTSDRWSITKVINNTDNRGGVLLGVNLNTSETYIGVLRMVETATPSIVWRKQLTEYDIEIVLEKLSKHMDDKNNPHKVTKEQVDLGNVENLPPVTRADIAARKPVRKMVTFDALLHFMNSYMNCIKTVADMEDENCDSNVIRNIKLVFAPCGPCGTCCTPNTPIDSTEAPSNLPTVDPYDTLYGWFCQGNAKIGIYADGLGGTTTRQMEENSADCSNDSGEEVPSGTPAPIAAA